MQLEHPDWVRRLNYFGPAVGGAEHLVPIDPDELLATARRATGLHDIGDDQWIETYRQSVLSMVGDVDLHLVGRIVTRSELLRVLTTRLRIHEYWRQHPAVFEEPIEAPIFILGPPRTGTTILFELLAHDPNLRAPVSWETNHPIPFDTPVDRQLLSEAEQQFWSDVHPPFQSMHELDPHLPAECVHFLAMDFGGPYWSMMYARPTFDAWAAGRDLAAPVYRFHRQFLQTLQYIDRQNHLSPRPDRRAGQSPRPDRRAGQSPRPDRRAGQSPRPDRRAGQSPRPWLLKSPAHAGTISALLAEYPDARFIHTHRDPTKFATSAANLMCAIRFMRTDDVAPRQMGPGTSFGFAFLAMHIADLRQSGTIAAERIADIHFLDLMGDPVAAVSAAYRHLGLDFDDGHATAITTYLVQKPKGKFGAHTYDAAELDLSDEIIREQYRPYVEHYNVRSEG